MFTQHNYSSVVILLLPADSIKFVQFNYLKGNMTYGENVLGIKCEFHCYLKLLFKIVIVLTDI
jgi:hypothetical protein